MYNRKEIKLWAKRAIKGRWFEGFCACFCVMAGQTVMLWLYEIAGTFDVPLGGTTFLSLGKAALLSWAFLIFVTLPLMVSFSCYFLRTFRGDTPSFGSAFAAFGPYPGYLKCLKGMLWVGMWYALWTAAPMAFVVVTSLIAAALLSSSMMAFFLGPLFIVVLMGFSIFLYVKVLGYAFVPFILAEYSDIGARRALDMSKAMAKGYKWALFELFLSFFFWMCAGALTLGILYIYVIPYMLTSFAGAYDRIKLICMDEGRLDGFPPVWQEMNA